MPACLGVPLPELVHPPLRPWPPCLGLACQHGDAGGGRIPGRCQRLHHERAVTIERPAGHLAPRLDREGEGLAGYVLRGRRMRRGPGVSGCAWGAELRRVGNEKRCG